MNSRKTSSASLLDKTLLNLPYFVYSKGNYCPLPSYLSLLLAHTHTHTQWSPLVDLTPSLITARSYLTSQFHVNVFWEMGMISQCCKYYWGYCLYGWPALTIFAYCILLLFSDICSLLIFFQFYIHLTYTKVSITSHSHKFYKIWKSIKF